MRVLMVGNFISTGTGATSVGMELADRLETRGLQVIRTSSRRLRVLRLLDMVLTAWWRRRDYDIALVDVFSGKAFVFAEVTSIVTTLAGRPVVMTLHGGMLPAFASLHPTRVRSLLGRASTVTAPSRFLLESLSAYSPIPIRLLRNGVDVARYGGRIREKPRPALVWLRAFHEVYRPSMAVEVLHRLRESVPDVTLRMVGPDKGDGSLARTIALADRLGVSDAVEFVGPVPKQRVPAELAMGDVFLNTTSEDNAPVTLLEAMAEGLCVVSTNVGGVPNLLSDGVDGLLVNSTDVDGMTNAVLRILSEPGIAARLSREAITRAATCDWTTVLDEWGSVLDSTLRGPTDDR